MKNKSTKKKRKNLSEQEKNVSISFNGTKKPSFHIGATPGKITHPYLFYERIKKWKRKDFLKKLEDNPQVEFEEKKEDVKSAKK